MSSKTNHFKIGLFVVTGVGLLLVGLFVFGVRSKLEPTTMFETYVTEDVEGLSVGSPVKLRGVLVGKVTRINFTWNEYQDGGKGYVLVGFEIKDSVSPLPKGEKRDEMLRAEIQKGLRARVKGQGITGTSILSLEYLDPAENPQLKVEWTPSSKYIPSAPAQFSQMLASIERSLRSLEKLDFEFISISLQQDLEGLGKVLRHLEGLPFDSIATNVNALVTEVRGTNGKLKEFIEDTGGTVKGLKLDGLASRAETLLDNLNGLAGRLDTTLDGVNGKALADTINNARRAMEQLNEVLHDLKEYPSGFILGSPPKPARSVEPSK